MDKKSLNNEIVSMRPEANRAKVHTISKLSREVKRLRVQKSYQSEAQKQKNLQKAERLVEELLLMKKLRHDEITKFALSNSKSSTAAILSNPSASPESRCLSRLALHIGLATRVEAFRTQFPNWETTLVSLMATIGVKVKRSKVLANSLGLLKPTVKLEDKLEDNSDEMEEESNTEQTDSDTINSSDQEEDLDNNSVTLKVNLGVQVESDGSYNRLRDDDINTGLKKIVKGKIVIKNANKSLKIANEQKTISKEKSSRKKLVDRNPREHALIKNNNDDDLKPNVNLKKDNSSKLKSKNVKKVDACADVNTVSSKSSSQTANKEVKKKVPTNRSKEMKVMRFTELLGLNPSTETLVENSTESSLKLTTKSIDSFFVTEDGKSEFFSTVPVKDPIVEPKSVTYAPQEVYDSSGRRLNRREIRSRLHGKNSFKSFSSRPSPNKNWSNKWTPADIPAASKWKDTAEQLKPKIFLPPIVDEPLHPSWEAKKKQKEQLNIVFQGTKIKFDE